MRTKFSNWMIAVICCAFNFCSCIKGDDGDRGPQGEQGPQGTPGNANMEYDQISIPISYFDYYSSTKVWGAEGTSALPTLAADDVVIAFIYMDPVDGFFEWVAMPYSHFFNTGNTFNEFFYSIETDGDIWFYIRNSAGSDPYSNMNTGSISYKTYVFKSHQIPTDLDHTKEEEVKSLWNSLNSQTQNK